MRKITFLLILILCVEFAAKAQQTTFILQENFSSIVNGNNTSSTGSSTAWTGNTNFPTLTTAYQAGGAVKLGANGSNGSIISKTLDLSVNGGNFNVSLDVKGWTAVEGSIKVTVTGLTSQTVSYTAIMSSSSFENKIVTFTGGQAGSTIKIETTAKRAYIDNVNVYYTVNCNSSNLSFASTNTINKIMGDSAFTQAATSLNIISPIVYSSSASGVATVDSSTGKVTMLSAGTTIITASQAASDGYCSSTASYNLIITPTPTLTITDITDPALSTNVGNSTFQTINVSAVNLSFDMGLSISGIDADQFSLSQYSLPLLNNSVSNTLVTVTYSPTKVGNHNAKLILSSSGAMDVTRTLNGIALLGTGLNSGENTLKVFVRDNVLIIATEAGKTLEIYNSLGQMLIKKTTINGENKIELHTQGVVLVKVGNQMTKVIL